MKVVRFLHSKGANLETPNNNGATPVYIACQEGQIEVVRFLHSKGANLETPKNNGATPVYIACQKGQIEVVRFLHSKGANLDTPNNNGWTPSYIAVWQRHLECLRELAWLGANLAAQTLNGLSPADLAACGDGRQEAAAFLTEVADAGGSIMWARAQRRARRWPVVRVLLLSACQRAEPLGAAVEGGAATTAQPAGALELLTRALLPQVIGWRVVKYL